MLSKQIFATIFTLSLTATSFAGELVFTPRASLSFSNYNFEQSERPNALAPTGINGNDFPEVTFDVTFKLLGIGGTFSKDGYYFDLFTQQSSNEEDTFIFSDPGLPGGTFKETFKGDRKDTSITFGKKILDNKGAIYIGHKTGESSADGNQGQSLEFKEDGFFIGANYAWRVGDGAIVVNIAYADLEGKLKEAVTANFGTLNAPLDIDATSDAQGVSYGISWSANISKHLNYSIGVDSQKYTFDNIKDKDPTVIVSDTFTEEFLNTKFTIFYTF